MLRRPHTVAGLLGLFVLAGAAAVPAAAQNPPAKGTVLSRDRTTVSARVTPGGAAALKVKHGTRLRITCQQSGPIASGPGGTSNIWDKVIVGSERLYVADVFLRTAGAGVLVAKLCGAPALAAAQTPGDTTGPCGITSPVAQLPPFDTRKAFIAAAVPGARRSDRDTKVPASVTLAQAILETGSGRIAAGANNYFGIKATAVADEGDGIFQWGVNGVGCVLRKTQEVIGGRSITTIGAFRAYESLESSIEDHGVRLLANSVYQGAFKYSEQPEKFARVIARYYATDPAYAEKVIGLMRSEKLTRYDVKGSGATPAGDDGTAPSTSADGGSGGATPSR